MTEFAFENLGDLYQGAIASATRRVVIVAPFIKVGALSRVLRDVRIGCELLVVTRWRLEELAAGVSDA